MFDLPPTKVQYMVVHDNWDIAITSWPRIDDLAEAQRLRDDWNEGMKHAAPAEAEDVQVKIVKVTSTYEWANG